MAHSSVLVEEIVSNRDQQFLQEDETVESLPERADLSSRLALVMPQLKEAGKTRTAIYELVD